MDRRKAMALMGAAAAAGAPSFSGEALHMKSVAGDDECFHCAVIRVNATMAECVVCGARIAHVAKAGFSISFEGHKAGA